VLGTLLSMKHELRDAGPRQWQHHQYIIDLWSPRRARCVGLCGKQACRRGKSAALEAAASGVRVNAVTPGPIETEMLNRFTGSAERKAGLVAGVPLQRVGKPDEIANAIVFLASDRSSFTTGQALFVDGGKSAI
jgi:hypothetical protein